MTTGITMRLLGEPPAGPPPELTADQLIGVLREAGLTGRGGAGFPVWRKLEAVVRSGRAPVLVANGAEGEPASGKDRALLAYRRGLVLDGMRIVADAIGARSTHLYLHRAAAGGENLHRAAAGGGNLRGAAAGGAPGVTVAPDRFVAGEESAAVAAIGGRAAVPADKRVRVTEAGFLVQNVETLAHVALIARHGPRWFRAAGTSAEPGTFLATVGGAVHAPGVLEAGYGVRLGNPDRGGRWSGRPGAGGADRRVPRWVGAGAARSAGQPGGAGAVRGLARRRRGVGAAHRGVRAGGDRPDRRLPRRAGGGPVWTVHQRSATPC